MKQFNYLVAVAGFALTLAFIVPSARAQGGGGGFGGGGGGAGGGGFNMAAMLQGRVDAMREDLAVTNNDEWSVISPRLLKVMQLQLEARTAGMGNMFGRRPGGQGQGGGGGRAGGIAAMFGGTPDPAAEALDTAVNNNSPVADLKVAMTQVRESRKKKQAEMVKAQADLKDVVSVRQEAYLVNSGILD